MARNKPLLRRQKVEGAGRTIIKDRFVRHGSCMPIASQSSRTRLNSGQRTSSPQQRQPLTCHQRTPVRITAARSRFAFDSEVISVCVTLPLGSSALIVSRRISRRRTPIWWPRSPRAARSSGTTRRSWSRSRKSSARRSAKAASTPSSLARHRTRSLARKTRCTSRRTARDPCTPSGRIRDRPLS